MYSVRRPYHIGCIGMVSHQYVFSYEVWDENTMKKPYYNGCIGMVSHQYVSSYELWVEYSVKKPLPVCVLKWIKRLLKKHKHIDIVSCNCFSSYCVFCDVFLDSNSLLMFNYNAYNK